MAYNGPAIWGGCVPAFFPKKRDGVLFAICLQFLLGAGAVAVQV